MYMYIKVSLPSPLPNGLQRHALPIETNLQNEKKLCFKYDFQTLGIKFFHA